MHNGNQQETTMSPVATVARPTDSRNNAVTRNTMNSTNHGTNRVQNSPKRKTSNRKGGNRIETDRTIHYAKIFESYDNAGKPKRVITIAYRVYPERPGMNVEYAASMFRKDNEQEEYKRKNHIQTARGRLAVRPLYTTVVFPDAVRDNLLEKDIPNGKEERRVWAQSKVGMEWKETRRTFDKQMSRFLRKEVGRHGCGAKRRLHKSEIERARTSGIIPVPEVVNNRDRNAALVQLFSNLERTSASNGSNSSNSNHGSNSNGNRRRPRTTDVLNGALLSQLEHLIV